MLVKLLMMTEKNLFWMRKIELFLGQRNKSTNMLKDRVADLFKSDRRKKYVVEKMKIAKKAGELLGKMASILFVGVTGSVASDWPRINDDIDLLIICKKDSLWITRIIATLRLKLAGFELRKRGVEKRNSLCLNMWLDESSLEVVETRQNILTALDLMWMKGIVNKNRTWQRFIGANDWIKKYLKVVKSEESGECKESVGFFIKRINWVVFWLQYLYMKGKIKKEIVDINRAYFHPKGKIYFDRIEEDVSKRI